MKKILIVGDSHVACLKAAQTAFMADLEIELDYLVAMGPSRKCLQFSENGISISSRPIWDAPKNKSHSVEQYDSQYDRLLEQLKALSPAGLIPYADYSALVLVGGEFFQKPWSYYAVNTSNFSKGFLQQFFLHLRQGHHGNWLKSLRKANTGIHVYSLTAPLMNELAIGRSSSSVSQSIPEPTDHLFSETYDFINYGLSRLGSKYVPLPTELFTDCQNWTRSEFKTLTPDDMGHLNNLGGEIRLRHLLNFIETQ